MSLLLFNSMGYKIYQKFLVLILFFLSSSIIFSQVEKNRIKIYEYSETTDKALKELYSLVGDDKNKTIKILNFIEELKKDKIYVLSTEEYLPIKKRIDYFTNNHERFSKEEYNLEKAFTSKLSYKYRVITDLIKMEL